MKTPEPSTTRTPPPKLPAPETFRDGNHAISGLGPTGGRVLLVWCPCNRSGAVLDFAIGRWTIYSPIAFTEFLALLDHAGVTIPAESTRERWMGACFAADQLGTTAGTC